MHVMTMTAGVEPRDVQNSFLPFYKFTSMFTVNYFDFKRINAVKSLIAYSECSVG